MIAFLTTVALACIPTADAHAELRDKHHEARVIAALSDRGGVLEVWASPTGTWTALVTRPDGLSCPVDAGQAITVTPAEPAGDPA